MGKVVFKYVESDFVSPGQFHLKDRFHGFITEGLKLRKESSNRVAFDHIIGTSLSREFCQLWFTLANFQQPFYQNLKSWLLYVLAYGLV